MVTQLSGDHTCFESGKFGIYSKKLGQGPSQPGQNLGTASSALVIMGDVVGNTSIDRKRLSWACVGAATCVLDYRLVPVSREPSPSHILWAERGFSRVSCYVVTSTLDKSPDIFQSLPFRV